MQELHRFGWRTFHRHLILHNLVIVSLLPPKQGEQKLSLAMILGRGEGESAGEFHRLLHKGGGAVPQINRVTLSKPVHCADRSWLVFDVQKWVIFSDQKMKCAKSTRKFPDDSNLLQNRAKLKCISMLSRERCSSIRWKIIWRHSGSSLKLPECFLRILVYSILITSLTLFK